MPTPTPIYPVVWQGDHAVLIDQTLLPQQYQYRPIHNYQEMATAIKTMVVRGAPAIGIAAAYGMYLGAKEIQTTDRSTFLTQLEAIAQNKLTAVGRVCRNVWAIASS